MAFGNSFNGGIGGSAAIADGSITAPKLNGAQTGLAPIYAARAWVNFDGTGVPTIRASGNVSSITDNGVGDYTVNFTTAMPDANYAVAGTSTDTTAASILQISPALVTTPLVVSSARVQTRVTNTGALTDVALNSVAIFR